MDMKNFVCLPPPPKHRFSLDEIEDKEGKKMSGW